MEYYIPEFNMPNFTICSVMNVPGAITAVIFDTQNEEEMCIV